MPREWVYVLYTECWKNCYLADALLTIVLLCWGTDSLIIKENLYSSFPPRYKTENRNISSLSVYLIP